MKQSGPRKRQGSPGEGRRRNRTSFAVDAMHGSLVRKLRALGFDSAYYKAGSDEEMIGFAAREGRLIVSSDRTLVARATSRGVPAILLKGKTDGIRLGEISEGAARLGISLKRGGSLCSLCGGELRSQSKEDVAGLVPPSVESHHRLFYRCSRCGHIYWHGGHWKKLRSLAKRLQER
jgi:uncharacterized protein